jgi:hypothetical protein
MYVGGYTSPDRLPPFAAPNDPMMRLTPAAPGGGAAPGGPSGVNRNGFPFDPCTGCDQCQQPQTPACVPWETWVRADWLFWHVRSMPIPPLISSGNPALPNPGVPQGGNYSTLVGPARDLGMFSGARLTFGRWFDKDGELGAEVSGFILGRRGTSDVFQDSPGRTLGVPFLSTNGTFGVYTFSSPGTATGSLGIGTSSQLYSGEAGLLHRWYSSQHMSLDGFLGFRFLELDESLGLFGSSQALVPGATFNGTPLPLGVTTVTSDTFRANTQFYGGEIGGRFVVQHSIFTLTTFIKGGFGANVETVRVDGSTEASGFGITKTTGGGVRALPSNFGHFTNTEFSALTDFGAELGVQVTSCLRVRVGYNLLYWSNVIRPGNTIDPVINNAQVPIDPAFNPGANGPHPVVTFHHSDLLAHGLVVGLTLGW